MKNDIVFSIQKTIGKVSYIWIKFEFFVELCWIYLIIFEYIVIRSFTFSFYLTHIRKGVCCGPSPSRIYQINQRALLRCETNSLIPHLRISKNRSIKINMTNWINEKTWTNLLFPCISWATISTREPYWYILPFGCNKAAAAPEPLNERTILFYEVTRCRSGLNLDLIVSLFH